MSSDILNQDAVFYGKGMQSNYEMRKEMGPQNKCGDKMSDDIYKPTESLETLKDAVLYGKGMQSNYKMRKEMGPQNKCGDKMSLQNECNLKILKKMKKENKKWKTGSRSRGDRIKELIL